MANVKLKNHRVSGPLLLRRAGGTYALTAQEETKVPLGIAVGMLGDTGLLVELNSDDEADILSANEYTLELLRREFGIEGDAKAIQRALFPKKSFAAKAMKTITPVEETPEETEAPEEVAEETIDYSKYTVKQLKEMLEERGLSTEGKKADLVERMSGAE